MPLRTGVYFFLRQFRTAGDAGYQHRSIALAEGLRSLGVPVFANINYWRLGQGSAETLFHDEPSVRPQDCDVVVAEHVYYDAERGFPDAFFSPRRSYRTVFIDAADGWRTASMPSYRKGIDLVLRCHYNSRFEYGTNVRPWAFGLSERILREVEDPTGHERRKKTLLCNHRAPHPVRRLAEERFIPLLNEDFVIDREVDDSPPSDPYDRLMWEQSGRRHHPAYYNRLKTSLACSAFGGYFVPSFARSLDSPFLRIAHKAVSVLRFSTRTVAQFDSWRFWESLAAGCVTFHIDLEHYGCRFPVMPTNGRHYVGIDLARLEAGVSRIRDGTVDLIGLAGKQWAIDHYSPVASAKRLLQYVQDLK